ncbi:MAG: NAD(P)(+) transhydrogenase (Re/Si-specific) subunit beta [Acidobacteria bacterium]|nr:NAD(P)(+) transhydrogenase (Re/Si-specific) subunit beta [Acidobacteriota bacterium]
MSEHLTEQLVSLAYLVAIVLFTFGIKRMGKVRTARFGNALSAVAMAIAIGATLIHVSHNIVDWKFIAAGLVAGTLVGAVAAKRVPMTDMPEMVALFNGSGGAASFLVALSVLYGALKGWTPGITMAATNLGSPHLPTIGPEIAITLMLSVIVGGVTLTGSVVAYGKLSGKISGNAVVYPGQHPLNFLLILGTFGLAGYAGFGVTDPTTASYLTIGVTVLSLVLGVLLVIPIGGADMPVVISLLNSYSGIAAAMAGFVINNPLLIVVGATVGAAGLILTQIMCVAMNRSLLNVLVGGFGANEGADLGDQEYHSVTSCGPEEAAMVLDAAESVIIIPGYGLAVAQAQHTCRELADEMIKRGTKVTYAIHPVAGRMPGHMNVLLAEADVPYEQLVEMEAINSEFRNTDVVLVVGANDVVNPASLNDPKSPIYGMPILEVHHAKTVMVIKRSLSPGFAGIKNELFEYDNTLMLFGDAKKMLQDLVSELKEAG